MCRLCSCRFSCNCKGCNPCVGLQVAILDAENRPVPSGKIGEVCSRGPNVTKGYLNNPAANKEAFAGGLTRLEFSRYRCNILQCGLRQAA